MGAPFLFVVTGLALSGPAAAIDCRGSALELALGPERSHWEELDADGDSLLTERGWLTRTGLAAGVRCGATQWEALWTHSTGHRAYDGQTTTGVPVQTRSRLRIDALSVTGFVPLGEGAWAIGGRAGWRQTDRLIASTDTAQGYPERFRAWQLAAGVRWRLHQARGWRLSATGWAGGGPAGTLAVRLPRADPLTLPLGSSRLLALGLRLEGGAASDARAGWSWQLGLDAQSEVTGAGAARPVTRNGVPVATARQPEIRQRQVSLSALLSRDF
ncbi:MAG: hypothetical protein EP306_03065 [Burkholderiales bacterium]|nr:MAG: hypothetical protein EP306_03065 [Burkholderiales bacterium]